MMTIVTPPHYFGETSNRTFQVARQEARKRGSKAVEAEHLLLGLASSPTTVCGRVLIEAGLDRERIDSLLRQERRDSVAYAGVELRGGMPSVPTENSTVLELGTSANEAIRRGAAVGHAENRVRVGTDLLLGILGAELGTVPRILALAGIDRTILAERVTKARRS
ncbi:MAG: Clp protease N-terminal domain-containing protein [Terrimesophilobacter sp.]